MKKLLFLVSIVAAFTLSAFAQTAPNFAGEWNLDKAKSKLDERISTSIESRTVTVEQTETELKATTATKRIAPPDGGQSGGQRPPAAGGQGGGGEQRAPMGGGQGGGRGMGGGQGGGRGGDGTRTFTLDGKDKTSEQQGQMGTMTTTVKAKIEKDGKLKVSTTRSFPTPDGETRTMTSRETWSLSDGGAVLTIVTESESPMGTQSATWVYAKKAQ